jgi:hypothetical protein
MWRTRMGTWEAIPGTEIPWHTAGDVLVLRVENHGTTVETPTDTPEPVALP